MYERENSSCFAVGCGTTGAMRAVIGGSYFRGSACHVALYCCKEHQAIHWKDSHKGMCQQMVTLSTLNRIVHSEFKGFYDFHFVLESYSDEERVARREQAMMDFFATKGIGHIKQLILLLTKTATFVDAEVSNFPTFLGNNFSSPIVETVFRGDGNATFTAWTIVDTIPMGFKRSTPSATERVLPLGARKSN
jgi:hypothetical protein